MFDFKIVFSFFDALTINISLFHLSFKSVLIMGKLHQSHSQCCAIDAVMLVDEICSRGMFQKMNNDQCNDPTVSADDPHHEPK